MASHSLSTKRSRRPRTSKHRKGAALVEFAIVVPVFMMAVFTCIEFCRLNMIRNLAQDAAYYATRNCMVHGATVAEAKAEVNRILSGMGTLGAQVSVNGGRGLDLNSRDITVTVTVPISENALFAPQFTGDVDIVATTTMRTERYDGFYRAGR